jgi:hypothetical protein
MPDAEGQRGVEATPTPTPEATPTPSPSPTPAPTPTPEPNQAVIDIYTVIDADRDLSTEGDRSTADNWAFELELTDGTFEPPVIGDGGLTHWVISFASDSTTATITEVVEDGFDLLDVTCQGTGGPFTGELDGSSFTFGVDVDRFFYECVFINARPTPTGNVSARITAVGTEPLPGDPTGQQGGLHLPSEFVADFGSAQVDDAHPVAHDDQAWWLITYTSETPIVITESVPDGYDLIRVACSRTLDGPDGFTFDDVPVQLEGSSVSFTAHMVSVDFQEINCHFTHRVAGSGALPAPPPTDTADELARSSTDWRLLMLLFVGTASGVYALTRRRVPRFSP